MIVCTYNRADIVPTAIESILAQDFTDFELLVVNDGSVDHTVSVVESFDDPRVRLISKPNGGLSAARNTGLDSASGDYVIFLDDDDRARTGWLSALHSAIDAHAGGEVGVVSCGFRYVSPAGAFVEEQLPTELADAFDGAVAIFLAGTFATRRDVYDAVGGYAEQIPTSHQTELSLRILPFCTAHGLDIVAVQEALVEIERRESVDRPLSQPAELLIGAEYLLDVHGEQLQRSPAVVADYCAVGGVSAAQLGDFATARRLLARAVRAEPRNPRHLLRLALAAFPPVARRYWGRHAKREDHLSETV